MLIKATFWSVLIIKIGNAKFTKINKEIANTKCEKLLGVYLDTGLPFDYQIQRFTKEQVVKFVR